MTHLRLEARWSLASVLEPYWIEELGESLLNLVEADALEGSVEVNHVLATLRLVLYVDDSTDGFVPRQFVRKLIARAIHDQPAVVEQLELSRLADSCAKIFGSPLIQLEDIDADPIEIARPA